MVTSTASCFALLRRSFAPRLLTWAAAATAMAMPHSCAADADSQAVDNTVSSLEQTVEGLSDDDCVCQTCTEKIAAGKWTGAFWVEYEMTMSGAPMKFHQKYSGTLDLVVKKSGEHYDESSLISDEDHIRGKSSAEMQFSMSGSALGASLSGSASNQAPLDFEADGPPIGPDDFAFILMRREPGGFGLAVNTQVVAPDAVVNSQANLSSNGSGNLNVKGHTSTGSFSKSTTVAGTNDSSSDKKEKVTWFQLDINVKTCATMSGKVNTDSLVRTLAAQGMNATVTDSNWAATFDDRDLAFEKKVEELLAEPLPPQPTTADVQELVNETMELRGNGDAYHFCVIAPLYSKIIRADLMLMRHEVAFVNWLPVDSLAQVSQGLQQIMLCMRFLQLMGAEKCQIAEDLRKTVEKKFQQAVRAMVHRSHTAQEMLGVERLVELGAASLGDVAPEFYDAWSADHLTGNPGKG